MEETYIIECAGIGFTNKYIAAPEASPSSNTPSSPTSSPPNTSAPPSEQKELKNGLEVLQQQYNSE
jgi:hypothetical protein